MAVRERIARLLASAGVLEATLRLRAAVRVPYLTILTYHHVAEPGPDYAFDPEVADVTPAQFRRHLDVLRKHFTVVGIDELCAALDGEPLPPNPAIITFDDGYRSCHDVAMPLLDDAGLRAVFFIPTSFVSERRLFWWERLAYVCNHARRAGVGRVSISYPQPREIDVAHPQASVALVDLVKNTPALDIARFLDEVTTALKVPWDAALERSLTDTLLMTWPQLRALGGAGMDIESHTRAHRVLQTLDRAGLDDELAGSREDLRRELGHAPRTVAYPVGRSIARDPQIRDAVERAGYRVGFTNASAVTWMRGAIDPLNIGRFSMDRAITDEFLLGQLAIPQLGYISTRHR